MGQIINPFEHQTPDDQKILTGVKDIMTGKTEIPKEPKLEWQEFMITGPVLSADMNIKDKLEEFYRKILPIMVKFRVYKVDISISRSFRDNNAGQKV